MAVVIVMSLQPPAGPPVTFACPAGSEFSRSFGAGPYAGWSACITLLPGGSEFSLWNVTASWDEQNDSVIAFVYHFNVDIPYQAYLHQNISYIEPHDPVPFWNHSQSGSSPGSSGETVQFRLEIRSLLFYGDDLSVVKEVRFYLAEQEPPIYDPANEPHRIVSDILSITFLPPQRQS